MKLKATDTRHLAIFTESSFFDFFKARHYEKVKSINPIVEDALDSLLEQLKSIQLESLNNETFDYKACIESREVFKNRIFKEQFSLRHLRDVFTNKRSSEWDLSRMDHLSADCMTSHEFRHKLFDIGHELRWSKDSDFNERNRFFTLTTGREYADPSKYRYLKREEGDVIWLNCWKDISLLKCFTKMERAQSVTLQKIQRIYY